MPTRFIRATDLVRIVLHYYAGHSLDEVTWTWEDAEIEQLPDGTYRLCGKP